LPIEMEDALARGNGNRSHEGTCHTLPGKASYMFYGNALTAADTVRVRFRVVT
jgi:hypothetical protein